MQIAEDQKKTSNEIDFQLRNGPFQHVPLDDYGTEYASWYARLLTTLTLIVGSEKIAYAQTDYDTAAGTVRFLIFLADTFTVTDVTGLRSDSDANPEVKTRTFPRNSLESFDMESSLRIDVDGSRRHAWPGDIQILASYRDAGAIEIHGRGYDPYHPEQVAPLVELIDSLRSDLA